MDIAVSAAILPTLARLREGLQTCYICRGKFILCFQGLASIEQGPSRLHSRPEI